MAKAYTAAMPPDTPLVFGGTVEFVAIDPTTGNAVSGVAISNSSIWYEDEHGAGTAGQLKLLNPVLIPRT